MNIRRPLLFRARAVQAKQAGRDKRRGYLLNPPQSGSRVAEVRHQELERCAISEARFASYRDSCWHSPRPITSATLVRFQLPVLHPFRRLRLRARRPFCFSAMATQPIFRWLSYHASALALGIAIGVSAALPIGVYLGVILSAENGFHSRVEWRMPE